MSYAQSYDGGGYSAGGHYAGHGGYGDAPVSGGSLNAEADLHGPGTSADLHSGYYSSYASESANGGIFEQNTTYSYGQLTQETTYSISNSYYSYSHASYYSAIGYYSFFDSESFSEGAYTSVYEQYGRDAPSYSSYDSKSFSYDDGQLVAGRY